MPAYHVDKFLIFKYEYEITAASEEEAKMRYQEGTLLNVEQVEWSPEAGIEVHGADEED
jgi:hypothetical protein